MTKSPPFPITIEAALFRTPCHWIRPTTGEIVVFDWKTWGLACHLAAVSDWTPRGTLYTPPRRSDAFPQEPTVRIGYTSLVGQTLEADDAAALGAAIEVAVTRGKTMEPAERDAMRLVIPMPSIGCPPMLAIEERHRREGGLSYPFVLLQNHRDANPVRLTEGTLEERYEASLVVRGLRRLARLLQQPGDVILCGGSCTGWIAPDVPTKVIKMLADPLRRGCGISVNGRAVAPGDLVLTSEKEADSLILQRLASAA